MPVIERDKRWRDRYFDDVIEGQHFVGFAAVDFVDNAPLLTDLARHTVCDVLLFDMERTAMSYETLLQLEKALYPAQLLSIVRIPGGSREAVEKVWNTGAGAISVPVPASAKEAQEYVRWTKFPPDGERSVWWGGAYMSYDYLERDYRLYAAMKNGNRDNVILVQPRTREDIDRLDEILDVDGISGIFIDNLELAINLGLRPEDDALLEEMGRLFEKTKAREQIAVGYAAPISTQTKKLMDHGMNIVLAGSDGQMFFALIEEKLNVLKAL